MASRSLRRPALVLAASFVAAGAGLGALAGQAERVAPGEGWSTAPAVAALILVAMSALVLGMALRRPRARRH